MLFLGSGVYAVYNGASYDQDCRFNYWGVNATAQMNAGVNPKNIGVIYDKYDYSSRGAPSTTPDGCSDPEAHELPHGNTGVVLFTDALGNEVPSYTGGQVTVTLWDADLNTNLGQVEQATVNVTSNTQVQPETMLLTETGINTGHIPGEHYL